MPGFGRGEQPEKEKWESDQENSVPPHPIWGTTHV